MPDIPAPKHLEYLRAWRPETHKAVIKTSDIRNQDLEKPEKDVEAVDIETEYINGNGSPSPSSINLNGREEAIDHIHSAWAPGESRQSIAGQFQRFPTQFIWQAIELTTAALENGQTIESPAGYTYGVAENILHRDEGKPLAHRRLPAPPPISDQDREAALAELGRIRERLSG